MLFLIKIKQISKPVLMEVDGAVAGAAANMAVAADFCIATDKAKFIQAFVGVGLAPDAGGIHLLSRSIGVTRAAQLAMTGEALTAEKALEWGLVYRISEADKLEKTREQLLKKIKTWFKQFLCCYQEVGLGKPIQRLARLCYFRTEPSGISSPNGGF